MSSYSINGRDEKCVKTFEDRKGRDRLEDLHVIKDNITTDCKKRKCEGEYRIQLS